MKKTKMYFSITNEQNHKSVKSKDTDKQDLRSDCENFIQFETKEEQQKRYIENNRIKRALNSWANNESLTEKERNFWSNILKDVENKKVLSSSQLLADFEALGVQRYNDKIRKIGDIEKLNPKKYLRSDYENLTQFETKEEQQKRYIENNRIKRALNSWANNEGLTEKERKFWSNILKDVENKKVLSSSQLLADFEALGVQRYNDKIRKICEIEKLNPKSHNQSKKI